MQDDPRWSMGVNFGMTTGIQGGRLYGLGIGPGDPELLTLKAYRLLCSAPVVAYPCSASGASVARSIVAAYLQPTQTELPFVLPFQLSESAQSGYDQAAQRISAYLEQGQDVAVLCEGDPFFYGTFMYLFQRLSDRFATEVIPGISSVMASAACLGTPLTFRNDALVVLSAVLPSEDLRSRLVMADAAVILKLGRHFTKVYGVLQDLQLLDRAYYIEYATQETQKISAIAQVDPTQVPYFSMLVIPSVGDRQVT